MHLLSNRKRDSFVLSTPYNMCGDIHQTQLRDFSFKSIEELLPSYVQHYFSCAFDLMKPCGIFQVLFCNDLLIMQEGIPQYHSADEIAVETIHELAQFRQI